MPASFPVDETLDAIRSSLEANRSVVLSAPPGSGKTTRTGPALLNAPFLQGKKILMLEPRRLAARSCAAFMAAQIGEKPGGTIGYSVRMERKVSQATRLEIITEGLLERRIIEDPELSDTGLVIFDEFHERSLQCDIGFAFCLDVRRALRPDLRMLVMSATLDIDSIAAHLGDADIHRASARMYPVETVYRSEESRAPVESQVAATARRALKETDGSILCFLPGEAEIRRTERILLDEGFDGHQGAEISVCPLYGAMSREDQDRAIAPQRPGERKIILATSIAETSITIDGVRAVVDSGLMRVSRFSPSTGMSRLVTLPLTLDRAEQRKGRAGRTAPGVCYRLWTQSSERSREAKADPEILSADLAGAVLLCASFGISSPASVPWLAPPPQASWDRAANLLTSLGALDSSGKITKRGSDILEFATHPRLGAMLLESRRFGPSAVKLAALLSAVVEETPSGAFSRETDLEAIAKELVNSKSFTGFRVRELSARRERMLLRDAAKHDIPVSAGALLSFAYPDRIAKQRSRASYAMTSGRGAAIDENDPLSMSKYLVCTELSDKTGDAAIRRACPVGEEEILSLHQDRITIEDSTFWDRRTKSVKALRRKKLGALAIEETPLRDIDESAIASALIEAIHSEGVETLGWTKESRLLQSRILFARKEDRTGAWPDVSDESLSKNAAEFFGNWIAGMRSWAHLATIDLAKVLSAAVYSSGETAARLDSFAPERIRVPSGSSILVHYENGEPYMAVKLQEVFGLLETPKIANGTIPVTMHLLSPAMRPVQVTKDLRSFWKNGYQETRKDLRGRYPKHYWPEDPFSAIPTRRVRPRPQES